VKSSLFYFEGAKIRNFEIVFQVFIGMMWIFTGNLVLTGIIVFGIRVYPGLSVLLVTARNRASWNNGLGTSYFPYYSQNEAL
jgi:hypothetical protein